MAFLSETWEKAENKNHLIEIEKMQEAIQKLEEQAEKGNLIDEELVEKFNQFQELLDSIMTPEILEALQKMQEALDNMDLEQMLEAVENFDYNLNQFEQQIDRFIEMFELALAEQKMEELVNALELLVEEESHIEDELKNGEDPNNLSSVQNRQNENFDNLQNKDALFEVTTRLLRSDNINRDWVWKIRESISEN